MPLKIQHGKRSDRVSGGGELYQKISFFFSFYRCIYLLVKVLITEATNGLAMNLEEGKRFICV